VWQGWSRGWEGGKAKNVVFADDEERLEIYL
jgi:hypothetical protein